MFKYNEYDWTIALHVLKGHAFNNSLCSVIPIIQQ